MRQMHAGKTVAILAVFAVAMALVSWGIVSFRNDLLASTADKDKDVEKEVEVKVLDEDESGSADTEDRRDPVIRHRIHRARDFDEMTKEFEQMQREMQELMQQMRRDQERMMKSFLKDFPEDEDFVGRDDWDITTRVPRFSRRPRSGFDLGPWSGSDPQWGQGFHIPEMEEFSSAIDVSEYEDKIIIKCDMPGTEKENIEVTLKGRQLTITGSRETEKEEHRDDDNGGRVIVSERSSGSFTRIVTLPENIDSEKITSKYEDGVLILTIPKTEQIEPEEKKIIIHSI
jgi:HSP20 family protein